MDDEKKTLWELVKESMTFWRFIFLFVLTVTSLLLILERDRIELDILSNWLTGVESNSHLSDLLPHIIISIIAILVLTLGVSFFRSSDARKKQFFANFDTLFESLSISQIVALLLIFTICLLLLIHGDKINLESFGRWLSDNGETNNARGLITFVVVIATVVIALTLVFSLFYVNEEYRKQTFMLGKDVLTIFIGILGTIMGFYYANDSIPTNRFTEIANQIEKSPKYGIKINPESRLIVLSGRATIKEANEVAENVKNKKISENLAIYKKRNSYRTVINNIDSNDEAVKLLAEAKKEYKDATLVRETTWCKEVFEIGEFFHCIEN